MDRGYEGLGRGGRRQPSQIATMSASVPLRPPAAVRVRPRLKFTSEVLRVDSWLGFHHSQGHGLPRRRLGLPTIRQRQGGAGQRRRRRHASGGPAADGWLGSAAAGRGFCHPQCSLCPQPLRTWTPDVMSAAGHAHAPHAGESRHHPSGRAAASRLGECAVADADSVPRIPRKRGVVPLTLACARASWRRLPLPGQGGG